jgi:hypothetical protein
VQGTNHLPSREGHTHTPAACAQLVWLNVVKTPGSCCSPCPTSRACSGRSPACMCPCPGSASSRCSAVLSVLTFAHRTRLHWCNRHAHVLECGGGRAYLAETATATHCRAISSTTAATHGCLMHHTACCITPPNPTLVHCQCALHLSLAPCWMFSRSHEHAA